MLIFVVDQEGTPLMPTKRCGRVRHMLKEGKAEIFRRRPFTIRLLTRRGGFTQPVEVCMDTGYKHIGISLKTEKEELASAQLDLLWNEKMKHDKRRQYRNKRRNRLRYRKPRFQNRKKSKKEKWLAPSIRNAADRHVEIMKRITEVCPVAEVYLEGGSFDTMQLKAIQEGKIIPEGKDYQHGPRYASETLRAAVFYRDGYKCVFCGRGLKDHAILHAHHLYYWRGQHGYSMDELVTCCDRCHTPVNHAPGGLLYGKDIGVKRYNGAAFMNTARFYIYQKVKELAKTKRTNVHMTYGTVTNEARRELNLEKNHVNDAYAMGKFHPEKRVPASHYKKLRRNNRVLERFYDAIYIDTRTGRRKKGKELGCNRLNRKVPRNSEKNLRPYRGKKISKGYRSIRRRRYSINRGTEFVFNEKRYYCSSIHIYGKYVQFKDETGKERDVSSRKIRVIHRANGWERIF